MVLPREQRPKTVQALQVRLNQRRGILTCLVEFEGELDDHFDDVAYALH
jgi:hypothetical protein